MDSSLKSGDDLWIDWIPRNQLFLEASNFGSRGHFRGFRVRRIQWYQNFGWFPWEFQSYDFLGNLISETDLNHEYEGFLGDKRLYWIRITWNKKPIPWENRKIPWEFVFSVFKDFIYELNHSFELFLKFKGVPILKYI